MTFSEIKQAVIQVWEFALPPFFNLLVLSSLTYYLTPQTLETYAPKLSLPSLTFLVDETFQKTLDFYGVNELAWIFVTANLIFILILIQALVTNVGHLVPGQLVYDYDKLLLFKAGPDRCAEIWARFLDIPDPHLLAKILRHKLCKQDAAMRTEIHTWERQANRYSRIFVALKFYLLWSVVIFVLSFLLRQPDTVDPLRLLIVVTITLIIMIFVLVKQVYALEQQGHAEVDAVQTLLYEDDSIHEPTKEVVDQKRKRCIPSGDIKWWSFSLYDHKQVEWFRRTFVGGNYPSG